MVKFALKNEKTRILIEEAIHIIERIGVPITQETHRGKERMAMALMAVANVDSSWKTALSLKDNRKITSRDIIDFMNVHFEENLSRGSYDDIRDGALKKFVLCDLIINSGDNPSAKPNDPTRGYSLDNDFKELIRTYGTSGWEEHLSKFIRLKGSFKDKLEKPRTIEKQPVYFPDGSAINLSRSYHNSLQKAIVEEFLPNFGFECRVLYIGDNSNRIIVHDEKTLNDLKFFPIGAGKLPDIIAYSKSKNWLFLIEAVTTSGPMDDERVQEIIKLCIDCTADLVFVTAFLNRGDFRKHSDKIGWETEAWIADNPKHLIHFNGDKFLGPFK